MNVPYALFDPHSGYNKLRGSLIPREKIRGYFYWRKTQRARNLERSGPSPDRPALVFRGGSPPTRLKARVAIPASEPLPGLYTIEVELLEPAELPPGGLPCRAFLVEQAVLDRLRTPGLVGSFAAPLSFLPEDEELALAHLFDHVTLRDELAAQQAVAALPEINGWLREGKAIFEADIPPGSPNLSDRARVVIVIDGPAG